MCEPSEHEPQQPENTHARREDVTSSGVVALRMAADNMPLRRHGEPWQGAAEWLHARADLIERAFEAEVRSSPE